LVLPLLWIQEEQAGRALAHGRRQKNIRGTFAGLENNAQKNSGSSTKKGRTGISNNFCALSLTNQHRAVMATLPGQRINRCCGARRKACARMTFCQLGVSRGRRNRTRENHYCLYITRRERWHHIRYLLTSCIYRTTGTAAYARHRRRKRAAHTGGATLLTSLSGGGETLRCYLWFTLPLPSWHAPRRTDASAIARACEEWFSSLPHAYLTFNAILRRHLLRWLCATMPSWFWRCSTLYRPYATPPRTPALCTHYRCLPCLPLHLSRRIAASARHCGDGPSHLL